MRNRAAVIAFETGFDGADATGDHLQAAIHADADQWSQTWME